MISLSVKIRKALGRKVKKIREKDILPAVLYGPKLKEVLALELDYKAFEKVYKEVGESSLISLEIQEPSGSEGGRAMKASFHLPLSLGARELKANSAGGKLHRPEQKNIPVLIHEIQRHPLTDKIIHVDFYQPSLKEEIEAKIPLVIVGEAPAVKDLGGTLIKNISEVEVKALPQNLPHQIKVDTGNLETFEDNILIGDLKVPPGVKIQRAAQEIVAWVARPEKVEEELVKPIEEKVEEVKKVEKVEKKKEEEKEESGEK